MRGLQGVLTYIDDVLCHARSHEEHLQVLEKVFLRLRKYGLKLNVSKSAFGAHQVTYLGYMIIEHGIKPGQEKLKAVSEFPAPKSEKD